MPDAARKWLEKHDEVVAKFGKGYPCVGDHSAVQHLRRLLEQNEMMQEALGAIKGYTFRKETDADKWINHVAKKALDA